MKKVIKVLWCTFGISVLIFICSVIFSKSDATIWRMFSLMMPLAGITLWGAIVFTALEHVRSKNQESNRKEILEQIKILSMTVTEEEYNTNLEQSYKWLVKLHDWGVDKDNVYRPLFEYLNSLEDGISYNFIADTLDFVTGWCSPEKRIWDKD